MEKTSTHDALGDIINAVADPVFVKDRQHRIVLVNDAFCVFNGRRREELIGKTAHDLFAPAEADVLRTHCEEVFFTRQGIASEEQVTDARGIVHTIVTKKTLCRDEQGHELLVGVFHDITRQKQLEQTEQALRNSEERYRVLFNNSNDAAFVHAPFDAQQKPGKFVEVNDVACRRLGYSRAELLQMSPLDIDAGEAIAKLPRHLKNFDAQGSAIWEGLHVAKNGRKIPVEIHAHRITLSGQPMVLAEVRDLSGQKEAEKALRESEALYQSLMRNLSCGIYRKDAAGQYVYANDWFYEQNGLTPEMILGKTPAELVQTLLAAAGVSGPNEMTQQRIQFATQGAEDHRQTMETGQIIAKDLVLTLPDGTTKYFLLTKSPVMDTNGQIIGSQAIQFDITARKAAETALQQSEDRYRALFNRSRNAVFVNQPPDAEGRPGKFVEVNDVACQRLGYSREELLQMTPLELVAPEIRSQMPPIVARLRTEGHVVWEGLDVAKDGRRIPVEIHTHAIELNGQPMVLSDVRDLSEQKRSEKALRESEHRYRSLFTNLVEGLAYCHVIFEQGRFRDLIYLAVNDAFTKLTKLKDVVGRKISEVIPGIREADPDLLERYGRVALTGQADRFEIYVNALRMWFSASVYSPQKEYIVVVFDVITERKQAEEELRKLSRAVEQSPVSIVITDPQGNMEYVNPKFIAVTGYTLAEVLGKNPRVLKSEICQPQLYEDLWTTILAGREWHGEFCNKKKNGELFWESVSISSITGPQGEIAHFVAVKEDITAHKTLESEFRQAQKMEAFGRLAAGVAHDFNNMMTSIMCSTDLLEMDRPLDPSQKEAVGEIAAAAQRAAALTRQLLMFSRRQAVQLKVLELNEVVENMGKLLRRLIGEDISLTTHYGTGGAPVLADAGMLEQVLMNLAVNSRDAMPKGGELMIETATVEILKPTGRQRSGQFIRLSVSDSGCGIAPQDLERVFEPFFTTKEVGKGTGLGLATVFGIVEQHKGWIEVESRPGHGTSFHIYLPRQRAATDPSCLQPPKKREPGGTETILLVEDDASVRTLARGLLTRYGYRVLEAGSGPQALAIWKHSQPQIDLLFTDVVMPGQMSGVELARQLLSEEPALKVLYASGYTDEMLNEDSALRQTQNFLEKPYSPSVMLRRIRSALDGTGS